MKLLNKSTNRPTLAVIILNWNGWEDTCECLASLRESTYQDFRIILIDNGSTDDSTNKIKSWANGGLSVSVGPFGKNPKKHITRFVEYPLENVEKDIKKGEYDNQNKMAIISSPENLGFAKGCNMGIRYAIESEFQYVLLINNDTTLEPSCINQLVEFMDNKTDIALSSPLIMYYDQPEIIWSYGGKLTYTGRRNIYYMNKNEKAVQLNGYKEITFISGCTLFARTEVFKKIGLLTEDFFFGEEDYELSLRMKRHHMKMAAIASAKAYHKVGVTNRKIFTDDRLPYAFIGYLNRFIDKKLHCSVNIYWKFWRAICLMYILPKLVFIHRYSTNRIYRFGLLLIQISNKYNRVDKKIFSQAKELLK